MHGQLQHMIDYRKLENSIKYNKSSSLLAIMLVHANDNPCGPIQLPSTKRQVLTTLLWVYKIIMANNTASAIVLISQMLYSPLQGSTSWPVTRLYRCDM